MGVNIGEYHMNRRIVQIPLEEDYVRRYEEASPEFQLKIQSLLRVWLSQPAPTPNTDTLLEHMNDLSQEAVKNGLTPDILEAILAEHE
jgi:hypothetical protein